MSGFLDVTSISTTLVCTGARRKYGAWGIHIYSAKVSSQRKNINRGWWFVALVRFSFEIGKMCFLPVVEQGKIEGKRITCYCSLSKKVDVGEFVCSPALLFFSPQKLALREENNIETCYHFRLWPIKIDCYQKSPNKLYYKKMHCIESQFVIEYKVSTNLGKIWCFFYFLFSLRISKKDAIQIGFRVFGLSYTNGEKNPTKIVICKCFYACVNWNWPIERKLLSFKFSMSTTNKLAPF